MRARTTDERHRVATPLELLVDLTFVVAVAQTSANLAEQVVHGRVAGGYAAFTMPFFAIWWAWMNFTWFTSAYDTDDVAYRIATFVQMAGVLVLAAGHDLRHTAACLWLARGVDPGTVQAWMGHESIATTNRYLHFLGTSADQAGLDRLNDPSRGHATKPDAETDASDLLGRSTREALRGSPTGRGYAGGKRDGPTW